MEANPRCGPAVLYAHPLNLTSRPGQKLSHIYAMARSAKNRRRTAQTQKLTAATPPGEGAAGSGTTRALPLDSVNEIV